MWKYETSVVWKEGKRGESHSGGKHPIEVATPPEFGGPRNFWSPEDLLTSSVASCIMTSALFFIERAGIGLSAYISNASCTMEKGAGGLEITGMKIDVSITLKDIYQKEALLEAMDWAERTCPLSKALKCPVELEVQVNAAEGGGQ
jgi:organic hydroperoxide reductase OsmC/OhrA